MARIIASSLTSALRNSTATSGWSCRVRSVASGPSPSGSRKSIRTTWGRRVWAASMASLTEPAVPTTRSSATSPRREARPSTINLWSSTIRTVIGWAISGETLIWRLTHLTAIRWLLVGVTQLTDSKAGCRFFDQRVRLQDHNPAPVDVEQTLALQLLKLGGDDLPHRSDCDGQLVLRPGNPPTRVEHVGDRRALDDRAHDSLPDRPECPDVVCLLVCIQDCGQLLDHLP